MKRALASIVFLMILFSCRLLCSTEAPPTGAGSADLIVATSAECTSAGDEWTLQIQVTVMNVGAAIVPGPFGFSIRELKCDDRAQPDQSIPLSAAQVDELNRLGCVTVSVDIPVDATGTAAPCCSYKAIVDSEDDVDESAHVAPEGEHNNIAQEDVCCSETGRSCPDLVVSGSHECAIYEEPSSWLLGVDIRADVTNAGSGPVEAPFSVQCGIPGQGTWTRDVDVEELNRTGTTTVSFPIGYEIAALDVNCLEYWLLVDSEDEVDESCAAAPDGEHNNLFRLPQPVCCEPFEPRTAACPDLRINGFYGTGGGVSGRMTDRGWVCEYRWGRGIENETLTRVESPFIVELRAVTLLPWEFPTITVTTEILLSDLRVASMTGRESVVPLRVFTVEVPADLVPFLPPHHRNQVRLTYTVDAMGAIDESCEPRGEVNNVYVDYAAWRECEPPPDGCFALELRDLTASCDCSGVADVDAGECIWTVGADVVNVGAILVTEPLMPVLISADGCVAGAPAIVYGTPIAPEDINPTGIGHTEFVFSGPPSGTEPCCEVTVQAHMGTAPSVLDEECISRNELSSREVGLCCDASELCIDLSIEGRVDCACDYVSEPRETVYECPMTFSATVTKEGIGDVLGPVSIELKDIECDAVRVGSTLYYDLSPDELAELNSAGTTTVVVYEMDRDAAGPGDEPCCTYRMVIDSGGAEDCGDALLNNEYAGEFCCDSAPSCPDLVIERVSADCDCGWTQQQVFECNMAVTVTVRNDGYVPASKFAVVLETPAGRDERNILTLDVGASKRVTLQAPSGGQGSIPYRVIVDVDDDIVECDETNNAYEDRERCS